MRKVLFVCTENACRSQMAESFFNKYSKRFRAVSAGSRPAKVIDPKTIKVMREEDVDLTGKPTNRLNLMVKEKFDYVVTMGCEDSCPVAPAKKTISWDIEDPKGGSVEKYREVRDEIKVKIKELINSIEE